MSTKICKKCNTELPLNDVYFQRRKDSLDGYRGVCRVCQGYKYKISTPIKKDFKICSKCKRELLKTEEYFNIDKYRPDGFTSQCKECRYDKRVFDIPKEEIPNGFKKCIDCSEILPIGEFKTNKHSKDGYYRVCLKCLIKRRRINCKEGYKICKKCTRELPSTREFFLTSRTSHDGLENTCLECAGRRFYPEEQPESWSSEDINTLRECYILMSKEQLLELFPSRTWKAIRNKANSIGLKRSNDYEKISNGELYKLINNIKHKKCKKCRRYLPFDSMHYPKDSSCSEGYRNICKECKGENFAISSAQPWSEAEEKVFIEFYHCKTNSEMIREFFPNRTLKNLQEKAYGLWIYKKIRLYKDKDTYSKMIKERSTDEWRKKISETHKRLELSKGEKNPMYGIRRIGKLNPNWKNGRTPLKQKIMKTPEYKEWRDKVKQRDNYKCQLCGSRESGNIEAHHLNNFAEYPEQRFDVENGITLCGNCHNPNRTGSYHNVFGTIGNTREEFIDYVVEVRGLELPPILK